MIYTRVLKSIFENYKLTLTIEDYQSFTEHVENLMNNYILEFSKYAAGYERGKFLHQLIEKEILASSHISTTCAKGCGACCHLEVEITDDDAAVLHQAIKEGATIDQDRLQNMALRPRLSKEWSHGAVSKNRCIFLGVDNACSIYTHRPATCRKVAVVSHPQECSKADGKIVPKTMPLAEIIMSAALSLPDNSFGSLATQLFKKLPINNQLQSEYLCLESVPVNSFLYS